MPRKNKREDGQQLLLDGRFSTLVGEQFQVELQQQGYRLQYEHPHGQLYQTFREGSGIFTLHTAGDGTAMGTRPRTRSIQPSSYAHRPWNNSRCPREAGLRGRWAVFPGHVLSRPVEPMQDAMPFL